MNSNSIQNRNIIPNTHFFIYKSKRYPFKFDFFKYGSEYFSANQDQFQQQNDIQLVDEENEFLELSDELIQMFIDYVQGEQVTISNDNVISLHFLSKKYGVKALQDFTKEYISNHRNELTIEFLSSSQYNLNSETDDYEEIISANLIDYVQNPHLLKLPFSTLYRILAKYYDRPKEHSNDDTEKVIQFSFKCLKKFGREASSLFSFVDFENFSNENLNKLLTEFSTVFDFHFINSTMVKSIYQTQNEILKQENENEIFRRQMVQEMNQKNEQIKKLQIEIKNIKKVLDENDQKHLEERDLIEKKMMQNVDKMKEDFNKQLTRFEERKKSEIEKLIMNQKQMEEKHRNEVEL